MKIPEFEDLIIERYLNTVEVYDTYEKVPELVIRYNFYTHDEASILKEALTEEFASDNSILIELKRTPIYTISD